MLFNILKALLSGAIIVAVSELAKRNNTVASIVHSLPLVSLLALLWLYGDTHDAELVGRHMFGTFWFVLPTLPMLLLVPWLLRRGLGFAVSLGTGIVVTIALYLLTLRLLKALPAKSGEKKDAVAQQVDALIKEVDAIAQANAARELPKAAKALENVNAGILALKKNYPEKTANSKLVNEVHQAKPTRAVARSGSHCHDGRQTLSSRHHRCRANLKKTSETVARPYASRGRYARRRFG